MVMVAEEIPAVEEFLSQGLIRSVESIIKTGKEASAYLCRGAPLLGARFAVAKVYHERSRRNFANSSVYEEGRVILNGQVRRAVNGKTATGRKFQSAMWVNQEFDTLCALADAGADVPAPYASSEGAILMEYLGDGSTAAPQLQQVALEPALAIETRDRLLWNVELWLANNIVHGDLSPYNVLLWKNRATAIDFPQAVDPRFAPASRTLLGRDIKNLARYFERHGAGFDAEAHADDLWERFKYQRL